MFLKAVSAISLFDCKDILNETCILKHKCVSKTKTFLTKAIKEPSAQATANECIEESFLRWRPCFCLGNTLTPRLLFMHPHNISNFKMLLLHCLNEVDFVSGCTH